MVGSIELLFSTMAYFLTNVECFFRKKYPDIDRDQDVWLKYNFIKVSHRRIQFFIDGI